jgi:hypothetical protein
MNNQNNPQMNPPNMGQNNPQNMGQNNPQNMGQMNPQMMGQMNPAMMGQMGQMNPAMMGQMGQMNPLLYQNFCLFLQQQNMNNQMFGQNMNFGNNYGFNNNQFGQNYNNQFGQQNNYQSWNVTFQEKTGQQIQMQITTDKTVKDIIGHYRTKSGHDTDDLKFFCQNKELNPNSSILYSGLTNGAVIQVYKASEAPKVAPPPSQNMGFQLNLIFESGNGLQITIQASPNDLMSNVIQKYQKKANAENQTFNYIINGQNLKLNLTVSQNGLNNQSKILAIATGNVIGA